MTKHLHHRALKLAALLWAISSTSLALSAEWQIALPANQDSSVSGRILLLLERFEGEEKIRLATNAIYPGTVTVAAQDVAQFVPGTTMSLDTGARVFRDDLARLPPGNYLAQAHLDRDLLYNLDQGGPGDLHSDVMHVTLPLTQDLIFTLNNEIPAVEMWDFPNASEDAIARHDKIRPRMHEVALTSTLLSSFWQRDTKLRAWVLLPEEYDTATTATWPTVYMLGTFGATHKGNIDLVSIFDQFNITNDPAMIWVFLDFWTPYGPSLFADSAHNGPWGSALVKEFIPELEARYRMDARAEGRLLTGHSSGGWSSVWLLAHFPETFGGAWATAPDPLDFRSFLTTNLYANNANLYFDEDGKAKGVARNSNGIVTTVQDAVRLEEVLAPQGGIFQSWDWVFSPPTEDGQPTQLFDRDTGKVNANVAAYWKEHYDLSNYLRSTWEGLAPGINGKLHVYVGTADNHYLNESVQKFSETMEELNADVSIELMDGKTHNNLLSDETGPLGLFERIVSDMYATARGDAVSVRESSP